VLLKVAGVNAWRRAVLGSDKSMPELLPPLLLEGEDPGEIEVNVILEAHSSEHKM
jgi:hypothetical protein